ncbi:MAG TPA: Asp-tRNA(Asn)/Glu-tRNA(Gln) amidotransferase subunit GatC [Longimicrobiales bacterium]
MAVTREDVLHVAALARLRLSPEEVERFTAQLNGILSHMEELNAIDVEGIEGVAGVTEWVAPLRAEDVAPDALAGPPSALAPAWRDGFYTVPRLAAMDAGELEEPFEDKAAAGSAGRPAPEEIGGGAA